MFIFSNKNIVLISPEQWGDNWVSKHHYALVLAERGNTVWFIAPFKGKSGYRIPDPHRNIHLISIKSFPGLNLMPSTLARWIAIIDYRRLIKSIGTHIDVIWSFDPYQIQFLKLFDAPISIYHPVDNHYTPLQERVVKEADLILSNSDATLARINHRNKHKIGHGIASYFFEPSRCASLPGEFKVKVGYVGNLNNKYFDLSIFTRLLDDHPNVGFYLIGPQKLSNLSPSGITVIDWQSIIERKNVFFLGQLPSRSIPNHIKAMDILLVLYKPDMTGFSVNPHKVLEYLSSGKLVIAPVHNENENIKDIILQADSVSSIPKVMKQALENLDKFLSPDLMVARETRARSMTYDRRLLELELIIQNLPKVNNN